jgi:hypothetical protein
MTVSIEELQALAKEMKERPKGYWETFPVSGLMGWLGHYGRCVYCDRLLASEECIVDAVGTVDHLLPSKNYPELNFKDTKVQTLLSILHFNCVPACFACNGLKRDYDPNRDGERLYHGPESFSDPKKAKEIQSQLIERARTKVKEVRQERGRLFRPDLGSWNEAIRRLRGDAEN